jgi:amidohydrolase
MAISEYNVAQSIRSDSAAIIQLGERFRAIPEPGFRELKTGELAAEVLRVAGAVVETGLAVTGIRGSVGPEGAPELILVADMDGLLTTGLPTGVPGETKGGMAHSCGHGAQMAVMLSVFSALARSGIAEREGMRLVFIGAPAEEYNDLDYRLALRGKGAIQLLSGKQELIRLGVFDRAAAVLKYHSMADETGRIATVNGTLNGFMAKRATFLGVPAHAGAWPEHGVNALNAAMLAQMAIHAQRETFRDDDHIRVHPVMREGGSVVNTVPERAVLETYVRGASFDAIASAAAKVDRALAAGAIAVGAKVRIENLPGYLPLRGSAALGECLGRAALAHVENRLVDFADASFASDDIGDVASVVPTCQLGFGGFKGTIHGADFHPYDLDRAYVVPAMILADAAVMLMKDRGALALASKAAFTPRWSREDYVSAVESFFSDRTLSWDPARS